jgi:hypothetical protein
MRLALTEILDPFIRNNFDKLQTYLRTFGLGLARFTFFEIVIPGAVTNYRYPHRIGYLPKDILQTSKTGAGSLTWNYELFDKDYLDITTTGACTVRVFVGNYQEGVDL